MKDFKGNEIHVGDRVVFVYAWKSGYNLACGKVIKLTRLQVKIEDDDGNHETYRYPHSIMVLKGE